MAATNRCGRPKRQGDPPGQPCRQPAGWGTPTPGIGPCKAHGGCLPVVVAKNRRTLAEQESARYLETYDIVPVDDPVAELQALAARAKAFGSYAEQRFLESGNGEWLALHAKAMNELAKQLEVLSRVLPPHQAAKAVLDHAQAQLAFDRIVATLDQAMDAAGLVDSQKARMRHAIGRGLAEQDGSDVQPLPPVAPWHGTSGALPGFEVAVDLLELLARSGPDSGRWSPAARQDVEGLQRAAQAFLSAWGHPADLVPGSLPVTGQLALEPVVADAEIVEDGR